MEYIFHEFQCFLWFELFHCYNFCQIRFFLLQSTPSSIVLNRTIHINWADKLFNEFLFASELDADINRFTDDR